MVIAHVKHDVQLLRHQYDKMFWVVARLLVIKRASKFLGYSSHYIENQLDWFSLYVFQFNSLPAEKSFYKKRE